MTTSISILGATGPVGQQLIALLAQNIKFKIINLVSSNQQARLLFSGKFKASNPISIKALLKKIGLFKNAAGRLTLFNKEVAYLHESMIFDSLINHLEENCYGE